MMNRCLMLTMGVALVLGQAGAAIAQTDGLDIERFKPSLDSQGMILTEAGQGEDAGDLNLGFFLHYSYRPLVITDAGGEHLRSLVDDRLAATFFISMGMFDWLTVGVEVPAVFWQEGQFPDSTGVDQGLASAGLGDIRVSAKLTALRQADHGISLALQVPVTLPSGDESAFLGSESLTAMPFLALSRGLIDDMLLLALNVGFKLQEGVAYHDLDAGHELFYRAGARLNIGEYLSITGEGLGGARFETMGENKPNETSLEWLVAAQCHVPGDLHLTLGCAMGTLPGWGTPNFRAFFGLSWSPRTHDRDEDGVVDEKDRCPDEAGPVENDGCPWQDSDSDGLTDDRDQCPGQAGPVENKGCPWGDADSDGMKDNMDKCPAEAGPAANEGCPWGDTDSDGLTDDKDRCPKEVGPADNDGCPISDVDSDGVKDEDDACPEQAGPVQNKGCPWGDADEDGLKDNVDKCPDKAEDPDGFEDDDGCPDPDNDRDGVPDDKDKCPNEPETINGYRDEDGCPDRGKVVVIVRKEKIEILQRIYFATGRAIIKRRSFSLLNQVAQTLRAHDQIANIRIEGHTDSRGPERANLLLSQRRAEAVRRYLIERGVAPERLEAKGYGESRPIAGNRSRKGREQNRRVEFVIVEKE